MPYSTILSLVVEGEDEMTSKQQTALSTCKNEMRYSACELGYILTYYAERSGWTLKTFVKKLEAFEPAPMRVTLVNFSGSYVA